jgi:hypothetical protein
MLFKWFLDLNVDDHPFNASTFSKNQERFLSAAITQRFLAGIVEEARRRQLISEEHFTVDGTLLDAWASIKSLQHTQDDEDQEPPAASGGKNPDVDYRGARRSNATHRSTTDPQARLSRKGRNQPVRLCHAGHVLMENRNGLIVDIEVTQAAGVTEWETALEMMDRLPPRQAETHAGGGQELRQPAIREGLPTTKDHASRRSVSDHAREAQRHRWSDDTSRGLQRQSARPQTRGGDLRLVEGGRRRQQASLHRGGAESGLCRDSRVCL